MSLSYKLKVGELSEEYLTDEEIWRIFTIVLSSKSVKSSTYKYALIKSIIENLYQINDNFELNYNQLAYSFTKIYWNLIVHHNLLNQNRGKPARVTSIIKEEQIKSAIPAEMVFDKIDESLQIRLTNNIKTTMKENVFGALFGDTRGSFYGFNHKEEILRLNPAVHSFMLNYQRIIVHLTNYHMAAMIEDLNEVPSINYLLGKVESIAKRSSLRPFEKVLLTYFSAECFYCGKSLGGVNRETHIDHFIPWSFVQSDHIWNLVLSCSRCNISKRDKLPLRSYLEGLIERNNDLTMKNDTKITTLMENYRPKKIIMLYDYSVKNGFDTIWRP